MNKILATLATLMSLVLGSSVYAAAAPEAAIFTALTAKVAELESLAYPTLIAFILLYIGMKVAKKVSNKVT